MNGWSTRLAVLAVLALWLPGCALQERQGLAPALVAAAGWRWQSLPAGPFDLTAASRPVTARADATAPLVVYIEGDGLAYLSPTRPAQDPTPVDPVALRLALAHPGGGPVAWLARPCQYDPRKRGCEPAYWTSARWAPEVVDSAELALDRLKRDSGADRLLLVGYSGGGALAALLAAGRSDVSGLVTIAANLDLDRWVRDHQLSPLSRSLNPADKAQALRTLPQIHIRGGRDTIVGGDVVRAFIARLPPMASARLLEIPDQDHECCWADLWPTLSRKAEFQALPGWLPRP